MNVLNQASAGGDVPASALQIRLDALTCKYMNTTNKVLPTWGIRPQVGNADYEGRVAPKLACVQDIRPHVPELGCTSAVQNEKMYFFIFVLLSAAILARACEPEPSNRGRRVPVVDYPCKSRLDALTCKYMNTTNKSIANLGYQTPSWQCRL